MLSFEYFFSVLKMGLSHAVTLKNGYYYDLTGKKMGVNVVLADVSDQRIGLSVRSLQFESKFKLIHII